MNDPGISRSIEIVLGVVASTAAAILILLTLMTRPGIGTPVTNWALGVWGPEGATISRAYTVSRTDNRGLQRLRSARHR